MSSLRFACALLISTILAAPCKASNFAQALLDADGHALDLLRADGSRFPAPKLEDQDSFAAPAISPSHEYAGWLAMFPDRGASYSQPIYLVVTDTRNGFQRFSGGFGMVFAWCFAGKGKAVVYRYMFSRGITPVGFQMRRLSDGKLLRRIELAPTTVAMSEDEIRKIAPPWTRCAQRPAYE